MTDILPVTPQEEADRIDSLPPIVLIELGQVAIARRESHAKSHRILYEQLPQHLCPEEITQLGQRICNVVEGLRAIPLQSTHERTVCIKRYNLPPGSVAERNAIYWLGMEAFLHGDDTTFQNAKSHLGNSSSLRGKIWALALSYEPHRT